jgi:hypothetical protein
MNKLMMKREEKKRGSGGYGVRERNRGRGKERRAYKGYAYGEPSLSRE